MVDRNKELAVNTVILGIGQLVPKLLALLLLPLLTAFLNTDEYGNYDLILSIAGLLIPIATLQIQQAVFRYIISASENISKSKYVTSAIIYIVTSSLVCYTVVFVCLKMIGVDSIKAFLICILFLSEALYVLLGQIIRGLGYNAKYSISVIVYSAVNLVATAILLAIFDFGLLGVILSLTLGYLSADLYMVVASGMHRYFSFKLFEINSLKTLLKFSVPIVPSSIALWIVNLSDRLIIIRFMGTAANGIYGVANKIPTLYSTAYNIFNLAWTETASKVSDEGNPAEYYSRMFKGLFKFLIGVMLVLISVTPIIFKLLVKGDYNQAFLQVPILYFAIFFNSIVNFYSGIYIALKRTKQVGYSSAIGAIINIIINIIFISKIGLYAASISTAISFLIIAIYRAFDLNKVIKIKYDWKELGLGLCVFVVASVCLFMNKQMLSVVCLGMAIVYNLTQNMDMIKSVIKKIT